MRSGLSITLWLLLAAASPAQHEPAVAAELTASEILGRMVQSYGSCTSYRDAGVVTTTFTHPDEPEKDTPAREHHSTKPFRTAFVRPGQFRFEYAEARRDSMSRYIVWQNGADVRTWWDVHSGEEREASLGMAIAGATGVSSGVGHTVPRLLLPLQVGGRSAAELANLERLSDEAIDDVACYRIKGLYGGRSTRVMWIDQASFLIRRIEAESDGEGYHAIDVTTYEPERDVEITRGELAFDPPPKPPPDPRDPGSRPAMESLEPRFTKAKQLLDAGQLEAALTEFAALWTACTRPDRRTDPAFRGAMLAAIGRLADAHPPAKRRFRTIFEDLDAAVRQGGTAPFPPWKDWIELGRALKQEDRILQLYAERCSPTGAVRPFEDMHFYAIDGVLEILIERRQFADAGRICPDPSAEAASDYDIIDRVEDEDAPDPQAMAGYFLVRAREQVSLLHALTVAAGRLAEAGSVAQLMLARDDTVEARRALVLECLHCEVGCSELPVWIAEIRRRGGDVADIEALMGAPPEAEPAAGEAR